MQRKHLSVQKQLHWEKVKEKCVCVVQVVCIYFMYCIYIYCTHCLCARACGFPLNGGRQICSVCISSTVNSEADISEIELHWTVGCVLSRESHRLREAIRTQYNNSRIYYHQ